MKRAALIPGLLALALLFPPAAALAQDYSNPAGQTDSYSQNQPPTPDRTGTYTDYTNEGRVTAAGTDNNTGFPPNSGALKVTGRFTNRAAGTVTATGTGTASGRIGIGIYVVGDFSHSGSGAVTATGTGTGMGGSGAGIYVGGNFSHSGSGAVTGTGTGTGSGYGGGIFVVGNFSHSGSGAITATGTAGGIDSVGEGIFVVGGFSHSGSGAVTATGTATDGNGRGISVGGDFSHSGSGAVTATGTADGDDSIGRGISVGGGFSHSGSGLATFLAYGTGGGTGEGLFVSSGGLATSGPMTLAAQADTGGTAHSIALDAYWTHDAVFRPGSTLYLAEGGNLSFVNTDGTTNAAIEPGARLVSLAATVNSGDTTTHTDFISGADGICTDAANCGATPVAADGANGFTTFDNGVYQYSHTVSQAADASTYSVTVTRLADASAAAGGAAGRLLAGLEQYWRGATGLFTPTDPLNPTRLDDPDIGWLYLLADVENAADVKAAGRAAFRQASPQATGQAVAALARGQQVVTGQFTKALLGSFPGFTLGGGYEAPPAGDDGGGSRLTLWGAPFYHTGRQDGNASFTDLDQDFTGFNLGATWWNQTGWGEAAFNYLNSDFDGDDGYTAEADGYGFSLGRAAKFDGAGQWNPRLALYGGWMPPDFDQRRRVGGLPFNIGAGTYRSSPDAGAWNVGLSLDNDFYFNPCTILRPRLALDYASTSMDGYTERGPADGLGLRVNADNYESFHVRSHGIMVRNQTPGRNPILQGVGPADRLPGPLASGAFWGIMDLPYGATGKIRPRRTERHMGARQRANGARRENDGADEALRAYGPGSANVKLLSKLLGLPIGQRGCELMVDETSPDRAARARKVLAALARLAAEGRAPSEWDTECLANLVLNDPAADLMEYTRPLVESPLARRQVSARTPTQRHYLAAMTANDLVFGLGPAGTGKTYLAVARAVAALGAGEVSRIIITRPAVEAGERLGFLPGDLAEKINPYLRPIYDALDDLLPYDQYVRLAERRIIEVAPLAFMRGRTLGQAFVILDEAQNCTREQMKMFLTRLGPGSRAVVTGDPDQSDLPDGQPQGLGEAVNILDGIPGIAVCRFGPADVIRHRLVRKIIEAYDQAAAGRRPAPGKMERGAGL